jgi:hypothetical protein
MKSNFLMNKLFMKKAEYYYCLIKYKKYFLYLLLIFNSNIIYSQGSYYPSSGIISDFKATYTFYKTAQYDYDFHQSSNGLFYTSSVKISISEGIGYIQIYFHQTGKKYNYKVNNSYRDKDTGEYYFDVEGNSNLSLKLSKSRINGSFRALEIMSIKDNSVLVYFNE